MRDSPWPARKLRTPACGRGTPGARGR
jgi:hypothetical protein